MRFPAPLLRGRLVRRYYRFLADLVLDSGEEVTAVCPNTGSMMGLTDPGAVVWVSTSDSPSRKYRHTWEMVEADLGKGPALVGINTAHPNALVSEAIAGSRIRQLEGYPLLRREVKYGANSRIDILLECAERGRCYVEVAPFEGAAQFLANLRTAQVAGNDGRPWLPLWSTFAKLAKKTGLARWISY